MNYTKKQQEDFMKKESNQAAAEAHFKDRIQIFREKAQKEGRNISREGALQYAKKHGFLKTETDKKIVDSVLKKEGVKSNPEQWRNQVRDSQSKQKKVRRFL